LEAAEAVGELDSGTFDLLDSLVNKSLVIAERDGAVVRYRQLETMRQYAHEKLAAAGEFEATRTRHLASYLALAEAAAPHLRRHEQLEWLARLDAEHDNVRTAMAWALATAPVSLPQAALRLAVTLARYWESRGRVAEHLAWLEPALDQADPSPSALRARALYYYAGALKQTRQHDPAAVAAIYQQALEMAQLVGDRATEAYVLMQQGSEVLPEREAGHDPFRQALALFDALGNRWGQANTLNHMSQVANDKGDLNLAEALMQRALSLWRQEGDRSGICHALNQLGSLAVWRGELDHALGLLGDALLVGETCGDVDNMAWNHHWTAQVAYRRADYAQMDRLYRQYQLAKEKGGDRLLALAAQLWRGVAAGLQGDYERALSLQVPVLDMYRPIGSPFLTGWVKVRLASTHLERGDLPQAIDLAQDGIQNLKAADNTDDLCTGLWCLGLAHFHSGDHAGARQALTDAVTTGHAISDPWQVGRALLGLGRLELAQKDSAQAAPKLREALAIFQRMGARREVADALAVLAKLALDQCKPERAAHLLGAAEALREEIGAPVPTVERAEYELTVSAVRAALSAAAFDAAWAEGRAMAWHKLVDDLLANTDS
jgi:tetratricopeptide (TPR) repeat protein